MVQKRSNGTPGLIDVKTSKTSRIVKLIASRYAFVNDCIFIDAFISTLFTNSINDY